LSLKKVLTEFKTREDFEEATRDRGIELTDRDVRLTDSVLIADEMGRINSRTFERVSGNIWAKKEFWIEDPKVSSAKLCLFNFCERGEDGAPLFIEVNGRGRVVHRWRTKREYWEDRWTAIPIPVEYLKPGLNEFLFHCDEGIVWNLWIENSRWPNRSAKSIDGGYSWNYERMGFNDSCDGEYVARLWLERYAERGVITSPVLDLATLAFEGPIGPRIALRSLRLSCDAEEPPGTSIRLEGRLGSFPSFFPDAWTCWGPVEEILKDEKVRSGDYRYFQWRAILETRLPKATPVLRKVSLEAEVSAMDEDLAELAKMKVLECQNEKIVRGSYPFAFQPYEERRLQILRERYELDWVTKPGRTDFEKLTLLRDWIRQQWEDGWKRATNWGGRLGYIDYCPPWDGLVILELAKRKLALGMCTHYSTAFVHACAALGYPARTVIIKAHCVTEVWSNEHKKWVMFDVGGDVDDSTKATYHFEKDGVPLSALEAHQAWIKGDLDAIRIVPEKAAKRFPSVRDRISLFERFCITLRNDELTSLEPGEPEHGRMCYHYDGYLWWKDERSPLPWFSLQSNRAYDFHWNVNVTEIHLSLGGSRASLKVQLETVTPNFDKFLVRLDGKEWVEKPSSFLWSLHQGINTLEVKSMNKFGREGIVSSVKVEYAEA
jgi:hypothetical protein